MKYTSFSNGNQVMIDSTTGFILQRKQANPIYYGDRFQQKRKESKGREVWSAINGTYIKAKHGELN